MKWKWKWLCLPQARELVPDANEIYKGRICLLEYAMRCGAVGGLRCWVFVDCRRIEVEVDVDVGGEPSRLLGLMQVSQQASKQADMRVEQALAYGTEPGTGTESVSAAALPSSLPCLAYN